MEVNIAEIGFSFQDYPDNKLEGALIVYMSGCSNSCFGCHNLDLKNPNYGEAFSIEKLEQRLIKESIRYNNCNRIVLMGGDPFFKKNINFTIQFIKQIEFNITLYTGHTFLELLDAEILNKIKGNFEYLKTGRYDNTKRKVPEKTKKYFQLASSNQEIYDTNFNLLTTNGRLKFEKHI
jgi:organic radical activating enzyme